MSKKRNNLVKLPERLADMIRTKVKVEGIFQHEIAADVGINQGRISEFLAGKRDHLMVRRIPSW